MPVNVLLTLALRHLSTQSGALKGYLCGDSPGSVAADGHPECGTCSADLPYTVMGTKSFTYVQSPQRSQDAGAHQRQFLLAARMWDGLSMQVTSPVFEVRLERLDSVQNGQCLNFDGSACGTQPVPGATKLEQMNIKLIQNVPTSGAQRWRHFVSRNRELGVQEFVAVANLIGPSSVYLWNASSAQPVDMNSTSTFHATGAASLEVVRFRNVTLLLVASASSAAPCAIYQVGSVVSSSTADFQLPGTNEPFSFATHENVGTGPIAVRFLPSSMK